MCRSALLLVGGITCPALADRRCYDRLAPRVSRRCCPAGGGARTGVRDSAAVAVSGVVASLSLAVALTVMVASFRDSVTHWLDVVLPADLYVRAAMGTGAADTVYFPPELVREIAQLPGVKRLATQRFVPLQLDPARPAVALISRDGDGMAAAPRWWARRCPCPRGRSASGSAKPWWTSMARARDRCSPHFQPFFGQVPAQNGHLQLRFS
jgi:putative ABC transport system permease protein